MIELEKTFLAKFIPEGLENCKKKEIIDIYLPKICPPGVHSSIRIRKRGDFFEFTKKGMVDNDPSKLKEETVELTKEEFESLSKIDGKKIHKIRHYFPYKGLTAEIDIFQGALNGLVAVEFEFANEQDMRKFTIPDFCLADITKEKFIAGGLICGKSYDDIKDNLDKYNYKFLEVKNGNNS